MWWNLSKIETSTPCLQITFVSVQNIRLFAIWVGLSIFCEYPADDVLESSSWPAELVASFFHQFELGTLKSPAIFQQLGSSLFVLLRGKLQTQKSWFELWYMGQYIQVKKHFFTLWAKILLLNNHLK